MNVLSLLWLLFTVLLFECVFCGNSSPLVVAHRGFSLIAPENTMPAWIKARDAGSNGIEADVRFTLDGQIVVLHDATVDRTSNCTGPLDSYTYSYLFDNCDFGYPAKFGDQFKGTKLPLFSELVQFAKTYGLFVVMDYKSPVALSANVSLIVSDLNMSAQVIPSCWYEWQIVDAEQHMATSPKQFLTSEISYTQEGFWETCISAGISGFSLNYLNASLHFISLAHQHLLSVTLWTINDPLVMENVMNMGVDAIITDNPTLAFQTIQQYNAPNNLGDSTSNQVPLWVVFVSSGGVFVVMLLAAILLFYFKIRDTKEKYDKI